MKGGGHTRCFPADRLGRIVAVLLHAGPRRDRGPRRALRYPAGPRWAPRGRWRVTADSRFGVALRRHPLAGRRPEPARLVRGWRPDDDGRHPGRPFDRDRGPCAGPRLTFEVSAADDQPPSATDPLGRRPLPQQPARGPEHSASDPQTTRIPAQPVALPAEPETTRIPAQPPVTDEPATSRITVEPETAHIPAIPLEQFPVEPSPWSGPPGRSGTSPRSQPRRPPHHPRRPRRPRTCSIAAGRDGSAAQGPAGAGGRGDALTATRRHRTRRTPTTNQPPATATGCPDHRRGRLPARPHRRRPRRARGRVVHQPPGSADRRRRPVGGAQLRADKPALRNPRPQHRRVERRRPRRVRPARGHPVPDRVGSPRQPCAPEPHRGTRPAILGGAEAAGQHVRRASRTHPRPDPRRARADRAPQDQGVQAAARPASMRRAGIRTTGPAVAARGRRTRRGIGPAAGKSRDPAAAAPGRPRLRGRDGRDLTRIAAPPQHVRPGAGAHPRRAAGVRRAPSDTESALGTTDWREIFARVGNDPHGAHHAFLARQQASVSPTPPSVTAVQRTPRPALPGSSSRWWPAASSACC